MSDTLPDLIRESTRLQKEQSSLVTGILDIQGDQIRALVERVRSLEQKMLALYAERHRRMWLKSKKEEELEEEEPERSYDAGESRQFREDELRRSGSEY